MYTYFNNIFWRSHKAHNIHRKILPTIANTTPIIKVNVSVVPTIAFKRSSFLPQTPDLLKWNYQNQYQLQMKRVRKIVERMLIYAKSFTPSHLPTTTIPNNCPTDCNTLLNSNGTKNMDIDFHIGLLSLSNLCDSHLLYCYL